MFFVFILIISYYRPLSLLPFINHNKHSPSSALRYTNYCELHNLPARGSMLCRRPQSNCILSSVTSSPSACLTPSTSFSSHSVSQLASPIPNPSPSPLTALFVLSSSPPQHNSTSISTNLHLLSSENPGAHC